jgi:hypothetical protein
MFLSGKGLVPNMFSEREGTGPQHATELHFRWPCTATDWIWGCYVSDMQDRLQDAPAPIHIEKGCVSGMPQSVHTPFPPQIRKGCVLSTRYRCHAPCPLQWKGVMSLTCCSFRVPLHFGNHSHSTRSPLQMGEGTCSQLATEFKPLFLAGVERDTYLTLDTIHASVPLQSGKGCVSVTCHRRHCCRIYARFLLQEGNLGAAGGMLLRE